MSAISDDRETIKRHGWALTTANNMLETPTSLPLTMSSLVDLLNLGDARLLGAFLALAGAVLVYARHLRDPLSKIPTVGGSDLPLLSYWGTIQFFLRGRKVVKEGYTRYRGRPFKIATLDRWWVLLTGPTFADEIRRAPDDVLSAAEASNVIINIAHTMGPEMKNSLWHNEPIRVTLTKNLDSTFLEVSDEVAAAFDDYLKFDGEEWTTVTATSFMQNVVSRATNRFYLGLPHCRHPEIIRLGVEVAWDVTFSIFISQLFPESLKHLVKYISPMPKKIKYYRTLLDPIILERQAKLKAEKEGYGYPDKPNDYLTWLLEMREAQDASLQSLGTRMLVMNFAAVHSTSMVSLHVLYTLGANVEHIAILREEAEACIAEYGWTRSAVSAMAKLDSYIKEVSRVTGFLGTTMIRMAMRDFTFSDGTMVPKGTIVGVPIPPTNTDEEIYPDAQSFDPWRFVDAKGGQAFTTTSSEWLLFGGGRHACPGRFFASAEIKLILAHTIMNYDVETETKGVRPKDLIIGTESLPNMRAKLRFRKRRV